MRILVYGAGNIGSIYAALLQRVGHDISLLARGERLAEIRDHGIRLENAVSGECTTTRVEVIERLDNRDDYNFVLVVLPRNRVPEVLPNLAANGRIPSVMFFGNNAAGPREMVNALGRERVLLGFPGVAAVPRDKRVRYLILSPREQPTTIGELDGSRSTRTKTIKDVLGTAGFPVAVSSNIDAWLKTHAAEIVPTSCALYMVGGDPQRLASTHDVLSLMLCAIRESYRVLRAHSIPITPAKHRIFGWLPETLLLAISKRMLESETTTIKIGHAERARDEMKLIADEFRRLARAASVAMPAMNQLYPYVDPTVEPLVGVPVHT